MQNTFIEIKTFNSLARFSSRIAHNNRNENHPSYSKKHQDFLNTVEVLNKDLYLEHSSKLLSDEDKKLKNKLMTNINMKTKRVDEYIKKLDKFFEEDLPKKPNGEVDKIKQDKLIKRIMKNNNELENMQKELLKFGDNGKSNRGNKHVYSEIILEITSLPKGLENSKNYGEDLLTMAKEYIQNLDEKLSIHSFSLHMDQSGMPHIHVLGTHGPHDGTMSQNMQKKFNDKFAFNHIQEHFNNFVQHHDIIKKYNLNVDRIVKGGKKDYVPLKEFKEIREKSILEIDKNIDDIVMQINENVELSDDEKMTLMYEKMNELLKNDRTKLNNSQSMYEKINEIYASNDEQKTKIEKYEKFVKKSEDILKDFDNLKNNEINQLKQTINKVINEKNDDIKKVNKIIDEKDNEIEKLKTFIEVNQIINTDGNLDNLMDEEFCSPKSDENDDSSTFNHHKR